MANPFVHIVTCDDPARAKEFYGKLLDWKLEDYPMGDDASLLIPGGDKGAGGGIMKTPAPGLPTRWLAYIEVDDVEKKAAQTIEMGGAGGDGQDRGAGDGVVRDHHRPHRRRCGAVGADESLIYKRGRGYPSPPRLCFERIGSIYSFSSATARIHPADASLILIGKQ